MEVSGHLHAPVPLPSAKEPPVPIGYEAVWLPEPVWTLWTGEKSLAPSGNRNLAAQPVVRRYTDWAIRVQPWDVFQHNDNPRAERQGGICARVIPFKPRDVIFSWGYVWLWLNKLALYSSLVAIYTTFFDILPTRCIKGLRIILRRNSDYFPN
jgi:hypothetical protein